MKSEKKSRPIKAGEPVLVRLQPELAAQINAWRRSQDDMPSKPEAIRRLIEQALASGKKR